MKYSEAFKRDTTFYLKNRHKFDFFGDLLPEIRYDKNGIDGIKCYWNIDSKGKYLSTKHVRIVKAILTAKKSVNWHIKEWVDGYEEVREGIQFYLDEFNNPPKWVEKAFRNQLKKKYEWRKNVLVGNKLIQEEDYRIIRLSNKEIGIAMFCPSCKKEFALPDHKVDNLGVISPSVVCGYGDCDYHQFAQLENWTQKLNLYLNKD